MDKGSGSESGIFPDLDPDLGHPKRPDLTGSLILSSLDLKSGKKMVKLFFWSKGLSK